MSSSPSSSSSSDLAPVVVPARAAERGDAAGRFGRFLDVACPVTVVLGTGHISVRQCLALERDSVVRLALLAGSDLLVVVGDVPAARGEIVITDDSTALRVTEIVGAPRSEGHS